MTEANFAELVKIFESVRGHVARTQPYTAPFAREPLQAMKAVAEALTGEIEVKMQQTELAKRCLELYDDKNSRESVGLGAVPRRRGTTALTQATLASECVDALMMFVGGGVMTAKAACEMGWYAGHAMTAQGDLGLPFMLNTLLANVANHGLAALVEKP